MYPALKKTAYTFVDGGYLRETLGLPKPASSANQYKLRDTIHHLCSRQIWGAPQNYSGAHILPFTSILRINYYDASDDNPTAELSAFWNSLEEENDVHLRFGEIRGRRRHQKGVDVLLAVDMLSGAYQKLFEVAILLSGDADFVPVVREVQRVGVCVMLVSNTKSTAADLMNICDRHLQIG